MRGEIIMKAMKVNNSFLWFHLLCVVGVPSYGMCGSSLE